jgi:hypothetical protein
LFPSSGEEGRKHLSLLEKLILITGQPMSDLDTYSYIITRKFIFFLSPAEFAWSEVIK